MSGLEQLLSAWRGDPTADRAVALCEELTSAAERARRAHLVASGSAAAAGSPAAYVPVVIAAGREAGTQHGQDPAVLLAIARMYLATGELTTEAQSILVRAARLTTDDPRTFRLLGDALLLRGDAQRAVRAFERAVAGGMRDDATRALHARACSLAVVQAARGEAEVALEVRRDLGFGPAAAVESASGTMRAADLIPAEDDELTRVKTAVRYGLGESFEPEPDATTQRHRAAWAADSLDDEPGTLVMTMEEILAAAAGRPIERSSGVQSAPASKPAHPGPLWQANGAREERDSEPTLMREVQSLPDDALEPDDEPAHAVPAPDPVPVILDHETTNTVMLPVLRTRTASEDLGQTVRIIADEDTQVDDAPDVADDAVVVAVQAPGALARQLPSMRDDPTPATTVLDRAAAEALRAPPAPPRPVPLADRLAEASRRLPALTGESDSEIHVQPGAHLRNMPTRPEATVAIVATGPPMRIDELVDEVSKSEVRTVALPADPRLPNIVPAGAGGVHRALAPPTEVEVGETGRRSRSVLRWLVAVVLLAAAGGAGYLELERRTAEAARETVELVERADRQMRAGTMRELSLAIGDAKRAFALTDTSRPAALAVVRAGVLAALDDDPARHTDLSQAIARARALGATEAEVAAASLAAAFARGDAAAARDMIAKSASADRRADALFELAAGAVLEAAGEAGFVARYEASAAADPSLGSAHVRLARAHVLAREPAKAAAALRAVSDRGSDRPEARVLAALAASVSPDAGAPSRPLGDLEAADVVRPLRSIAWILRARERPDAVGASSGLAAAVDDADVASVMVFCGGIALELGDLDSAQRAVGRATTAAPRLEAARALEAEVALARGKLDDARRAVASTGVAGARARVLLAYEDGDLPALVAASSAVPAAAAVLRARIEGSKPPVAAAGAPPLPGPAAELVECDAALDRGDLAAAKAVVARWPDARTHPLRAIRWARLERYQGRPAPREVLAAFAPTREAELEKLLARAESRDERGAALAALGDPAEPDKKWLAGYLRARHGGVAQARRQLARLRPPAPDAPVHLRIAAALALAEILDRGRGELVIKPLLAAFSDNPDVTRAAAKLGLKKK